MADFKEANTAERSTAGAPAQARLGPHGMVVSLPLLTQLTLEGRVFIAGHGIEETATNTLNAAAINEQSPMFILLAPTGGTIVVPIEVKCRIHAEGGAAPVLRFGYVQADRVAAGSGTDQSPVVLSAMGGTQVRRAQAILTHTVTSTTAITDNENVALMTRDNMVDNIISAEMIAADRSIETLERGTLEWTWVPPAPIMLYKSSALCIWGATNNATQTSYSMVWHWAELDAGKYLPDHLI